MAATNYSLTQQAGQQLQSDDAFSTQYVPPPDPNNPGAPLATITSASDQSSQGCYGLNYSEDLSGGQISYTLDERQTDRSHGARSNGGPDGGSAWSSDAAHTYSLHQEGKSDAQDQTFAFVSHAYDDARWGRTTTQSGPYSSSDETTDTYSERMQDAQTGLFTLVHSEVATVTGPGADGNPQTTTTPGGWTTVGTFRLGDPTHVAPGGATLGGMALGQVLTQYQALAQQASQDLQRAIAACAAAGQVSTGGIDAALQQVLGRLLPAVQGLPARLSDLLLDRGGKALVDGGAVVGLSLPAKLTGVPTQAQRLQQMADMSVLFLNGLTFGTIGSLRTEAAALAQKYGSRVYWAANVAGASAGVIGVVVGAAVTATVSIASGGTVPAALLTTLELVGGGAAFGLALGVGSQLAAMLDGTRPWGDFSFTEVASSTLLGAYFGAALAVPGVGAVLGAHLMSEGVRGAVAAFRSGNVYGGLFDAAMVVLPVLLHGIKQAGKAEAGPRSAGVVEERPLARRSILSEAGEEAGPRDYGRPQRPGDPPRPGQRSPLERGLDPNSFDRVSRDGLMRRMTEGNASGTARGEPGSTEGRTENRGAGHLNGNEAVSEFGIYEIMVNGVLYKQPFQHA